MASEKEYLDLILEQLSGLKEITYRAICFITTADYSAGSMITDFL